MQIQLDSDKSAELEQRRRDVDGMLSILICERRDATRESAFLAWSQHSDPSAASWLVIDRPDDVVTAHDRLVVDDLSRRAESIVRSHGADEIHDFARDCLAAVSTDREDPDVLTVTGIDDRGEKDVDIGVMSRWGSEDAGLVEAIAERFDLELPTDFERSCRRDNLMTMLRMTIVDKDGCAC